MTVAPMMVEITSQRDLNGSMQCRGEGKAQGQAG